MTHQNMLRLFHCLGRLQPNVLFAADIVAHIEAYTNQDIHT